MNALDPNLMTADERLDAVARILATGIQRLLEKEKTENISLDKSPDQWLHGLEPKTRRE